MSCCDAAERGKETRQPLLSDDAKCVDGGTATTDDDDKCDEKVVGILVPDDGPPAPTVDLIRISIYLTCIQSFTAAICTYVSMGLSACLLGGSAARTILMGVLTGLVVTSSSWTIADEGCRVVMSHVLVPLTVVVPVCYLSLLQLESSTFHERTEANAVIDDGVGVGVGDGIASTRAVVSASALALAGLGALERTLWPRTIMEFDVLLTTAAAVLSLVLHPNLETLDDSPEPLCECPSRQSTPFLRAARLIAWVCVVQTTVLCMVPRVLEPSSLSRLLVCSAAAAGWTLLAPHWLLPLALAQIVLMVCRRAGIGSEIFDARIVVTPPSLCTRFVRNVGVTTSAFAKGLHSVRSLNCSFRIPWRLAEFDDETPMRPVRETPARAQTSSSKHLNGRSQTKQPIPVLDCTGTLQEQLLVERLSAKVRGPSDASVGVAKLIASQETDFRQNPYAVRTLGRLAATLNSRR